MNEPCSETHTSAGNRFRGETHQVTCRWMAIIFFSISKIDDVNMEYSVQLTFREEWVDGRLAYGLPGDFRPDFLILTAGQQIWMPDSFFQVSLFENN